MSTCTTFQTESADSRSSHSTPILFLKPSPLLISNWGKRRLWECDWFEIRKSHSILYSYSNLKLSSIACLKRSDSGERCANWERERKTRCSSIFPAFFFLFCLFFVVVFLFFFTRCSPRRCPIFSRLSPLFESMEQATINKFEKTNYRFFLPEEMFPVVEP